jgi:hypothetical protein
MFLTFDIPVKFQVETDLRIDMEKGRISLIILPTCRLAESRIGFCSDIDSLAPDPKVRWAGG